MHIANSAPQSLTTPSQERHCSVFGWFVVLVRFRFLMHTAGTTLRVGIKYVDLRNDQNTTQSTKTIATTVEGILMQSLMIEMVYGTLGLLIFSGTCLFTACNEKHRAQGIQTGLKNILGANVKYYLGAHSISLTASIIGLIAVLTGLGLETTFFAVPVMIGLSTLCLGSTFNQDDKIINRRESQTRNTRDMTTQPASAIFFNSPTRTHNNNQDREEALPQNASQESLSAL